MIKYKSFYSDLCESAIVEDYPSNWIQEEFEKINSFAGKLRYANEHLQKLASGSGRAVFKIDDQKVLKIAKNKKGLAQNNVEGEWGIQNYSIVAKTFDRGNEFKDIGFFWIEMEFCKKVSKKRFKELTGGISIEELHTYLHHQRMRNMGYHKDIKLEDEFNQKMENNEFVQELQHLNGDYDMETGDQGRPSTFGEVLRDGKPKIVLVDYGLTASVFNDYYKVSFK